MREISRALIMAYILVYILVMRQEGRGQNTTVKRMTQPLRKTGYDKNWLEPTRPKMLEDLISSSPWISLYAH